MSADNGRSNVMRTAAVASVSTISPITLTAGRPAGAVPRDGFGRVIDYLRISLTDRCTLRCRYCMPTHGLTFIDDESLLTAAEIQIVAEAAAGLGFRKIRLTGGEPMLRRDILGILERIRAVDGIDEIAMTTNGARLAEMAERLAKAGLNRVNVHVDSLDAERMPRLMRWGEPESIMAGILAAEAAGLTPIKINVVVARGYNEEDVVDLAKLSVEHPWDVRFIELMPLGGGEEANFSIDRYVSNVSVRRRIEEALGPLEALANSDPSNEARNFRLSGAPGRIGFISPVSEPYCGTCNRMRLTADGKLHLCLLHDDEIDVRAALRGAGSLDVRRSAVALLLARAVAEKPTGHALREGVHTLDRRMHSIGG